MTAFIFFLSPTTGAAQVSRLVHELETAFPHHDFVAGDAGFGEYDNQILPLLDGSDEMCPDPRETEEVVACFRAWLHTLQGWRPS